MEKNKFLTFVFSFVPGAGYMYLNMMAKGTAFMIGFAALSFISAGFRFNGLIVFLPVLWCYTFFDTFHTARMDYQTRLDTDYIFIENLKKSDFRTAAIFMSNKKNLLGWLAILVAVYLVIYSIFYPVIQRFFNYDILYVLMDIIPTIIVVTLLFCLGRHLIKKEKAEDFLPYKGKIEDEDLGSKE